MVDTTKKPVWLDCDPGHDDAFAIILAAYHPSLELIGISTVTGNQTLDRTTQNAYKVAYIAGLPNHIPIIRGCSESLCRHVQTCPEIHGQTGLDGTDIPDHPEYKMLMKEHDENYLWNIYKRIIDVGRPVTLIATGQLTNIALLLKIFPQIKQSLAEIVLMGGCIGIGNMQPGSEFNIMNDPDAAHIVFTSPHVPRLVMVPLELTHTVCATQQVSERLRSLSSSRFISILDHLLHFFAATYKQVFQFDAPPLHDPCAVAYVANKDLFEEQLMRVDIERTSEHCQGRTICDIFDMHRREKNCVVITKIHNVEHFWNMMIDAIELADKRSEMSYLNNHEPLCIVQGCSNGLQTNPSMQYFAVPVHITNIAASWYKNTMRTDLRPSTNHRVCEQHFEESCFDHVEDTTKVLRPKSLPTLFDLEVFYKMIAYQNKSQETNKTNKKTNITFHTSNPEIDGRTLEPILKLESGHVKTRLAPTTSMNSSQQESIDKTQSSSSFIVNKTNFNHHDTFENKASNRCHIDGCIHNYVARRHRVQLYKIPRDQTVARKWLDACGFEHIAISSSTSTFKVCREHFTVKDFEGPAILRPDAVPSLFTTHSRSLMDKQNSSQTKRFRSDMTNNRAKQTSISNNNNNNSNNNNMKQRTSQLSYRNNNNNNYQRQQDQQQQNSTILSSPIDEMYDDNMKQMMNDTKQIIDIDLNMNCSDDHLSDVQLAHCPVKALDRTDTTNGVTPKPRNPVGRPRIHPRYSPTSQSTQALQTTATNRRSTYVNDDPDEFDDLDEWNVDEIDQDDTVRDRDWINRQQDDRLPWSKRSNTTTNNYSLAYQRTNSGNSYRNIRQPIPFQQHNTINNQQRPAAATAGRGQFYQTQFVKPEPTRKATIPFLQPAFAPNASTQYPRDQPLPRLKPGTVRTREEGLEVELEHTYKRALSKYYGQKPGRTLPYSDYGDFRSQCPVCEDSIFDNNIQLITHLCQHFDQQDNTNNNNERKLQSNSPFEQINTKCSHCQSEFSNPYFLAMHIDDKHMLEMSEYPCRICEQRHTSLLELIAHLNLCHCGLEMPYFCEVCSFRTSMHADMIYHIDEVHKGTRYFFCPYCFIAIELPLMTNSSTMINGTLAYKHLLLHFNKVDQGRTIQSKFKHCRKCILHVASMKDHLQRDHLNIVDGIKATYYDEDENQKQSDEGEQYDDSIMDTTSLPIEKSSTARYITPAKSG
ncbi:unnamed protein product [Adineta steineri]|uniref:THAP-type domain-containing protein n=1 Tax=Adineta steineri TaxID=433720 RepID=A0A815G096_9BILA|nr:unnamed protein product [Adineta steineri]CAF1589701.1 unnamed protein product [Adineta steineri]